ncbi:hypothetical protein BT93_L5496 [Corymbia citriodora subsp. variegata]|uniref:Hcy-binding domain-containing protein n=1 Tax=Corymbia citriodora subsp. variegata TaxID=360336 RepID=A0A8T0CF11_CORYI|nr:hypothetical protein BT93_L5496 [Corymbia citriodora subsp. variegata]
MPSSLLDKDILLLDGGLGTTLEDDHGIKFDSSTPLWSAHLLVTNPDLLEKVQQDFVKAGADIILTPTYQASYDGFVKTVVDGERIDFYEEICQYLDLGVDISRHAFTQANGLVALSLGAYGATMIPSQEFSGKYGAMDEQKLEEWHCERIAMYWASYAKVDLVAFETIPRLDELCAVKIAANANRHGNVYKPYWVSCVFPNEDNCLPDGSTIKDIVKVLLEETAWEESQKTFQPWGIGINCTKVQKLPGLVDEFEAAAQSLQLHLPRLVVYPNGANGQTYDSSTQTWVGTKEQNEPWVDQLWDVVRKTKARGKWEGIVVGGCCKSTVSDIHTLRQLIDSSTTDTSINS